jgi:hypothetical protein
MNHEWKCQNWVFPSQTFRRCNTNMVHTRNEDALHSFRIRVNTFIVHSDCFAVIFWFEDFNNSTLPCCCLIFLRKKVSGWFYPASMLVIWCLFSEGFLVEDIDVYDVHDSTTAKAVDSHSADSVLLQSDELTEAEQGTD